MMSSAVGGTRVVDKGLGKKPPSKPNEKKTKFDVIIIGAGPAGYTAGIYCSRARRDTLILSGILPGGQLVNTTDVENYPGFENGIMGPDLMINIRKQTERMGTTIIDEEVVIAGGGDSAIEEATFLTKFASTIHLVHRREQLRASKIMQERAFADKKIKFHWNKTVEEIIGNGKVQKVVLRDTKTNEKTTLEVGGIFVAIGHDPNTKLFANQIELDKQGYIVLKENTKTSVKGVFAAGDVHDRRYRQAITAAGFGCMAAIEVDKFLSEN